MNLNYDLHRVYEWPLIMQITLLSALSVLLFYLVYLLDISSINDQKRIAIAQEKQLITDFKSAVEARVRLQNNLLQFPKLESMMSSWNNNILNSNNDVSPTLDALIKLGEDAHVKFDSFDPEAEIKDGSYYKVPIKISMTGTYDQIATFLSSVANYPKLIVIDNFTIANEPVASSSDANSTEKNITSILHGDNASMAQLILEIYHK
jgi:type IV pilus assembly protein PilO